MSFFFAPFADELLSACPGLSFDELLPFSSDLSFSDLSFSSDLSFCSDLSFDELVSTCPDDKAVARTKRTANAAPQTVSISPTLPRTSRSHSAYSLWSPKRNRARIGLLHIKVTLKARTPKSWKTDISRPLVKPDLATIGSAGTSNLKRTKSGPLPPYSRIGLPITAYP